MEASEPVRGTDAEDHLTGMADDLVLDLGIQTQMVVHQVVDSAAPEAPTT